MGNYRYQSFGAKNLYCEKLLNQYGGDITPGVNPYGGMDYYVDNNYGSDGNDGLSWDTPKKTLAQAITLSNANIAADARGYGRGWASRNRIFYRADTETADLVAFPNKCDVIGVGSYDANVSPGITGNHVPVNAGNYGTRFFNVWFKAPADASPIVTLASSSSGIQFIGCTFDATATTTIGIQATASPFLKVLGCDFRGAFVTSYITFGAGEAGRTIIDGNIMTDSAAAGIVVNISTTTSWASIISNNFLQATALVIDDNSDLFYIYNNHIVELTDDYTTALDVNAARCVGNTITTPNVASPYPVLDTTT